MLRGLRTEDATILQRLCAGDTRLYLRLGALLQAQVAITETALETALSSPQGKLLLNDRRLKDVPPAGFAALVDEHGCGQFGLILADHTQGVDAPWRVIALDDELNNPLLKSTNTTESTAAEPVVETHTLTTMMSNLTPALRAPVEGLLQARADDQRAAALEQLRYAAPPLTVVSELMPMLLADAAELVRERAIGLLVASGASVTVVDLVRALHRRDDAAISRLSESILNLPAAQLDVVVAALVATATRGQTTQAVVNLCQALAPHLIHYRQLERLLELLLPHRLSLISLVRELQRYDSDNINRMLHGFFGRGSEADATILLLLSNPGTVADDKILQRGIDLLLSVDEAPKERMALASALRRLAGSPARLVQGLIAKAAVFDDSHDTSIYWLIAELCRDKAVDSNAAEILGTQLKRLLRDAPGPHIVAIMEQQLPALIPASDATRCALVEPLVEIVARFRDDRSLDLVASCLNGIGPAATSAMWILLEEHPHEVVRLLAADLLPQLIIQGFPHLAASTVTRLLKGLQRAQQARERGALVTASARIAQALNLDHHTIAHIEQSCGGLGEWAIDCWGYLAAAQQCPADLRVTLIERLLHNLTEELPDRPVETVTDSATDEITFILDPSLGAHTNNIPRVLTALQRIGVSPALPPDLLHRLIETMCKQWSAVANWQVIWGPANIQELGRVLGSLAGQREFPGPLRVRICEALIPKINQLSIARALVRVFVVADGPYLSRLAGKASEKLIHLANDKYYAEDEWPDMVEVLIDYVIIPHQGENGDAVRRRLINTIQAYRTHLTTRGRAKLRAIIPDLALELRERLDWV
jgi:hypothetical protein